jgi:hypothetical protein
MSPSSSAFGRVDARPSRGTGRIAGDERASDSVSRHDGRHRVRATSGRRERQIQPGHAITPLGALGRGVIAGLAGTAAMTVWQELLARLRSRESRAGTGGQPTEETDPWQNAPAPAQVAKRLVEGLFQRSVGPEHIGLLTNVTHWAYGTAWGGAYGLVQGTLRVNALAHGLVFGTGVWVISYVELVPMGIYEPPWTYPARALAKDLSYHLVYGLGAAKAFEALAKR